jgi:hypothetical protein
MKGGKFYYIARFPWRKIYYIAIVPGERLLYSNFPGERKGTVQHWYSLYNHQNFETRGGKVTSPILLKLGI